MSTTIRRSYMRLVPFTRCMLPCMACKRVEAEYEPESGATSELLVPMLTSPVFRSQHGNVDSRLWRAASPPVRMFSMGNMEECSNSSGVAADFSLPSSSRSPGNGNCHHLVSGAVFTISCQMMSLLWRSVPLLFGMLGNHHWCNT